MLIYHLKNYSWFEPWNRRFESFILVEFLPLFFSIILIKKLFILFILILQLIKTWLTREELNPIIVIIKTFENLSRSKRSKAPKECNDSSLQFWTVRFLGDNTLGFPLLILSSNEYEFNCNKTSFRIDQIVALS